MVNGETADIATPCSSHAAIIYVSYREEIDSFNCLKIFTENFCSIAIGSFENAMEKAPEGSPLAIRLSLLNETPFVHFGWN